MNCENEKIILIITGCINPNPYQGYLVLKNVNKRLKQYIESITFYIENPHSTKSYFAIIVTIHMKKSHI